MIDFIAKFWVQTLLGLVVTGLGWVFTRIRAGNKEQKALKDGIKVLIRDRLIQGYNYYVIDSGEVPIYALESLNSMFGVYESLGGNGTVSQLMEEIKELPKEQRKKKPAQSKI